MTAIQDIHADPLTDEIKAIFAKLMWKWFESNKDRKLFKVGIWFIHRTVKVSDLRDVFVLLFGPEQLTTV